jgi:Family of unknown function (DUF6314)
MIRATKGYLEGDWLIVRIIENAPDGLIGELWGEARFVDDGEGLTCHETGVLRFQGEDFHMERVSLWRFPEPGHVEVRYADGRPFHQFLTEQPIALEIEGDASFEILYEFQEASWISRWQMDEAGRSYLMTTLYRR